ncbi:MAG: hypothetical protein F4046_04715 [Acidimicrobiaceae bacterium]|nr:hypothetical protein [Acidimicrobiaceae bacterium]
MASVEVWVGRAWQQLSYGSDPPRAPESGTLRLRGFDGGETVMLGPLPFRAGADGCLSLRLSAEDGVRGHLGLIEVRRESGTAVGEVEVEPDKLSTAAYELLRADLERSWVGLLFDPDGIGKLCGVLPSPDDLWRVLEKPLRDIAAEPRSVIASREGARRLESVRRPCELTAGVVRASRLDRPGRSRVLSRDVDTPENALVAETLRRLAFYARRSADGFEVAALAGRLLRSEPFASCAASRRGMEASRMRTLHDPRYRRVDHVRRILDRPEAHATEGPGEARLGVKAIVRLYEYWVFLQVLTACARRYGPPFDPGFSILGRRSRSGTVRLGIPPGATVSFPGDVLAAFEPRIEASGRGWQSLENVPHPDKSLAQNLITPDVVVLSRASDPAAVVFDAKYVGRHWVDYEAARIHARYSRIRLDGRPVVRSVLAAHPHPGKDAVWAGYGSVPMIPGAPVELSHLLP